MIRRICLSMGLLLLLFSGYLGYERVTPRRLTFAYTSPTTMTKSIDAPIGVAIPTLGISLPIFPSTIKGNSWPTTDKGVSYLLSSPRPGDTGNSILYAHNWPNLFGKLPQIKIGDTIRVYEKNTKSLAFTVKYTAVVDPSNASILATSSDKRITLYTCTGFLDSKRFVVVATL